MREIVFEAHRFEHDLCESEFQALALENEWIQKHRPKWNVAGAFSFLYPMIGVRTDDQQNLFLVYTTQPELFPGFHFHGAFRSRERTREGFFSLIDLLRWIGHVYSPAQTKKFKLGPDRLKYSYLYGFRQIPTDWQALLHPFFQGKEFTAIEELSLLLLERPTAVAHPKDTQDLLRTIRRFWRHEILSLKKAREHTGWSAYPVPQKERDLLFITHRSQLTLK